MNRRNLLILFAAGLVVSFITVLLQRVPGYMDAEYYYAGGLQLARGEGFYEPFLWNYLDNPSGIPRPSHTYWMPLSSLIASAGMILTGSETFLAARLFFILLAACVPVVTACLARELGQSDFNAMLAGLLATFPGFYAVYLTNTETFTLYMLLGGIFIWLSLKKVAVQGGLYLKPAVLGLLAGMMHLTRAEGLIWLAPAAAVIVFEVLGNEGGIKAKFSARNMLRVAIYFMLLAGGYLLIMAPWYTRNLRIYGLLMSPGGSKTLWLTNYDQTFIYHTDLLTPAAWMEKGWRFHLLARWGAFIANIKNLIGVQGEIFLLPLILLGVWKTRTKPVIWLSGLIWLMIIGLMTIVFPYSGARGGYIHSGAALQPLLWVLAVIGLDAFVAFGERIRNWDVRMAKPVFASGLVALSIFLTVSLFYLRVYGGDVANPVWEASWKEHAEMHHSAIRLGLDPDALVMVNNPPGYFVATGQSSIVIPDGNIETLVTVAKRYKAQYVFLQRDHVAGLNAIYKEPGDTNGLRYLGQAGEVRFYEVAAGSKSDE